MFLCCFVVLLVLGVCGCFVFRVFRFVCFHCCDVLSFVLDFVLVVFDVSLLCVCAYVSPFLFVVLCFCLFFVFVVGSNVFYVLCGFVVVLLCFVFLLLCLFSLMCV